uniref:Phospholipase/Carboxylesterase n=1 Tax=Cyanothece sp. (strain PCC 7425 / ATCC 29141) TaxID=395961 RepID=B8HWY3_CYAP4
MKPTLFPILRSLLPWLGMAAIAYTAACLALWFGQNRLIFLPENEIRVTPADYQLSYQDVWLTVSTDRQPKEYIHGWWIPAQPQRGVLLYLHGNGINIGANTAQALRFQQLGLSVFLFDYRGYGRSQGRFPTEAAVYQDALIAWTYLTQQRRIPPQDIFIFGHSLGGAIAIQLATTQSNAAGVIVQSSFTSMADMAEQGGWSRWFPLSLLLNQKFDSLSRVKHLRMPVLYLHGAADDLVPAAMGQQLFAATTAPKKLVLVPAGGHNNLAEVGGEFYLQALQQFISLSKQKLQPLLQSESDRPGDRRI